MRAGHKLVLDNRLYILLDSVIAEQRGKILRLLLWRQQAGKEQIFRASTSQPGSAEAVGYIATEPRRCLVHDV